MQKSENNGEMQDSLLLLTIGENKVVESCDFKSASEVEEMDDSGNAGTSTQLTAKWLIQKMQIPIIIRNIQMVVHC